jgi:hypothetical protein
MKIVSLLTINREKISSIIQNISSKIKLVNRQLDGLECQCVCDMFT